MDVMDASGMLCVCDGVVDVVLVLVTCHVRRPSAMDEPSFEGRYEM